MAAEPFRFAGGSGAELDGRLELPSGKPHAVALFAHCFTCTKQSVAATRIARELAERGYAVLRFDFTGLGGSGGDFANAGFVSNLRDLVAAADALAKGPGAPSLLIGHSLGGAAVLAAARDMPSVRAVVTIAAPFDVAHVLDRIKGAEAAERDGEAAVTIAGQSFRVTREFIEQARGHDQAERAANLDRALMVMHSPVDAVVGIDNARQIFEAARHPKSFISLDGADHLLTSAADADYVAGIIAAWAVRY